MQGQEPPKHNTIARFRSQRLTECIEDLFNHSFVWKKVIDKLEIKLQEKIKGLLLEIANTYNFKFIISDKKISTSFITTILEKLNSIKESENLIFVSGKGRRKSKLQKYVESLNDFIEKQSKYDSYNNIFNGRNSFSKTDNDATFMRMKEKHMKNGQFKPWC